MQTNREMTTQQAFAKLSALCARSEHCQHDMVQKLRQWGLDEEQQAEVMARLVSGRFVDDDRFARAFVNDKVHYTKWGRRKIEQALWAKHVDSDTIARALDDIADEVYADVLRPLLKQKERSVKAASAYELSTKLIKFALSRGYTIDVIRLCMETDDADELPE